MMQPLQANTTFDFADGNGPVPAKRHPNGGGWVADTARVDGNANVYERALVCGDAQVFGEARVSRLPLTLTGLRYSITSSDTHTAIGCQNHPSAAWASFSTREIADMDGRDALKFWKAYKSTILALIEAHKVTPRIPAEG